MATVVDCQIDQLCQSLAICGLYGGGENRDAAQCASVVCEMGNGERVFPPHPTKWFGVEGNLCTLASNLGSPFKTRRPYAYCAF